MTQRKLTDAQLQRRIQTQQNVRLRRIAAKHAQIAQLQAEIADLHGELHELPGTMTAVRDFGPRAAYMRHAPEPVDEVSTEVDTPHYIPHVQHLLYNAKGVENLCKCDICINDKENAS